MGKEDCKGRGREGKGREGVVYIEKDGGRGRGGMCVYRARSDRDTDGMMSLNQGGTMCAWSDVCCFHMRTSIHINI